jgi:membrane protease YdiL (CAAX protease family)
VTDLSFRPEVPPPLASTTPLADRRWLRPELVASWGEIAAVLLVVIGLFAGRSTWMAFHGSSANFVYLLLNNTRLLGGAAVESGLLAALLGFLHCRGWTPQDFKIKPAWLSSLEGCLLFPAVFVGNLLVVTTLFMTLFILQSTYHSLYGFLLVNSPRPEFHSIHVSWIILIGTMVLNAFYEEMTCMGYAFNQFAAKQGPFFALILTVCLRMACHTYQGPVHMLGIGMVFTIFGLWYWYSRNLWPLIAGHALLDIASTGLMKLIFG